jgi:hypothetical protein
MFYFGSGEFTRIRGFVKLHMTYAAALIQKSIPVCIHRIPNGTNQAHACDDDPAQILVFTWFCFSLYN